MDTAFRFAAAAPGPADGGGDGAEARADLARRCRAFRIALLRYGLKDDRLPNMPASLCWAKLQELGA